MTRSNDPFEAMVRLFAQMHGPMRSPGAMDRDGPRDDRMRRDAHANRDGAARDTGRTSPRPAQSTAQQGIDTNLHTEETDDGYVVMVDLPGFDRDDLVLRYEDDVLSIRGETDVTTATDAGTRRHSRRVAERVAVPGPVADADITATYRNGVLEVTLPHADDTDSNRIDIE